MLSVLIRKTLFEKGVNSHLAGVDTLLTFSSALVLDSVTFTGIYRAKGNEAAMVVHHQSPRIASPPLGTWPVCAIAYLTAITRSKALGTRRRSWTPDEGDS